MCKWNGKQGLNGCHAETGRRWGEGLPSQISFVQASCMPAGWLLGSFVWLITSPLRDTKPGHTRPSELRVSQPPVFTLTGGQGHGSHAGKTPDSFIVRQPIINRDLNHGTCLNEAVSWTSLHSLKVWTVTLAALCLKEEMSWLNSFGRIHWWPLIWILSLHVSIKCAPIGLPALLPLCLFTLKINAMVAPACDRNASFITLSIHSCHKGVVFLMFCFVFLANEPSC